MVRDLPDSAGGILSYFTRHKTLANLLLVVLLMAGAVALPKMRAQFFPDVVVDSINISVAWNGAGAEDVDQGIVKVLEPALLAVEGVSSASSRSTEGRARISLEFDPDWDMSRANADVETALDGISTLPDDAEDPIILRGSWSDRVTEVVISGPIGVTQLGLISDEFALRLFNAGVTKTSIQGIAAPQVVIEVPTAKLVAEDITMRQIANAIAEEVSADPAGDVLGSNMRVRTGVEKRSAEDIAGIVLRSNGDGSKLTIGDVAFLRDEGIDRLRSFYVGDNQAITLRVDRSAAGDAIAIQEVVEEEAAKLERTLPQGTTIELIRTRADAISGRLNLLLKNGATGLLLVVLLLFLFLDAKTAFWVAAGIPTAMFTAIALMYVAGITFNMISLFALILTLGIIVDDAIVVGEHADFRARRGSPPMLAAETAAKRMALPVFAASLTTIIAFFGLTAISGRFGSLIADIPFTVIAVLIASLVECFLILPNHMAHSISVGDGVKWYDLPSHYFNKGFRWFRDTIFRRFIRLVITMRYVMLSGAIALLISQIVMIWSGAVSWRFINFPEQSSVTGNFAMVNSASREDTMAMMKLLQESVDEVAASYEKEHGKSPIDYVLTQVGGNTGRGLSGVENKSADLLGGINIELIDADLRPYSSYAFVADLQDQLKRHPLLETFSFRSWRGGPGGDSLDVQFYGKDAETLKSAAEDLKTAVARFPIVSAVEDDLSYDKEEMILELTPQGQVLGFTIDGLGAVLRGRLNGIEAATYPLGTRSAELRVELPENELSADFLERMQLRSPQGEYVPLADIVSVELKSGFSTVRRENGIRLISVTGDISEDDPVAANEVIEALENEILPEIASKRQVEWRLAGLAEEEDQFRTDAQTGLILCLTGIYLVLTWIFSSWTRPIIVMAIIPFGLIGTIWGHYIWDIPMSMFTVIGLLGMTGIIINDSIVLITTIDEYAEDRGIIPSLIDATVYRFRPVLLTTLTTVLGLAPLLYERSTQAQFLKPTVVTLVYGLGFGMILVLIVVPSLIAIQQDVMRYRVSLKRALSSRNPGVRMAFIAAVGAILAWFATTMGVYIVTGDFISFIGAALNTAPSIGLAFVTFIVGALVVIMTLFVASHLTHARRRTRGA